MATRPIVPRADNEGGIGTTLKKWATGFIKILTVDSITIGTLATQNPPLDADLWIIRASASAWALVTATGTQVKAFLKTYFDTLYDAAGTAAGKIAASISDGDTTHAPDANSVFDALALKQAKTGDGLAITAGKTITCTQDTALDEAVAMSSKAPLASPTFTGVLTSPVVHSVATQTASVAAATPTIILTTNGNEIWFVTAFLSVAGETGAYFATAMVFDDGALVNLFNYAHGAKMALTVSGHNVLAAHSWAGSAVIRYNLLRM